MAVELGTAYLSIAASTKGMERDIRESLGQTVKGFDGVGKRGGSALAKGLGRGLKIVGGAVAGVTALVGGLALKGGISRALNIEDAKAKMRGLGHDTKVVDTIMANALASVKGTAFGLGDAATVAASAVAAGIEPGENLERVLSSVANAAAAAGTDLTDMGAIYNDAATQNKATNRILQQVAQRGLPIYQALADQLGVTAEEVFKMASAGKIGFAEFEEAMTTASGTVAAEMGDTLRGRIDNTMAALGRLGEKVVEGILPQISDGLGSAIDVLDSWAPHAEAVGEAIGKALKASIDFLRDEALPVMRDVADWFKSDALPKVQDLGKALNDHVVPALKGVVDWVKENRTWLEPLTVAVVAAAGAWKLVTGAIAAVKGLVGILSAAKAAAAGFAAVLAANPIGLIIAAVAALVAGLVWFFTQTELGKEIWENVWGAIKDAAQAVADWWTQTVAPALSAAWDVILDAARSVADWYTRHVAPVFKSFGDMMSALFERIASVVSWLWRTIYKPVLDFMLTLWKGVWSAIVAFWEKVGPPLFEVAKKVFESAGKVWAGVWNAAVDVFTGIWSTIKTVAETLLGSLKGIFDTWTAVFKGDWSGAWDAIKGVFSGIWDAIVSLAGNQVETLGRVFGTIKDTVLNVFKGAGEWLKDVGARIINGLKEGIESGFNRIKDTLTNLTDRIPDWKGPAKRDKKLLTPVGRLIMQGLVKGIADSRDLVRKALESVTKSIVDFQVQAVKKEADALIKARKKANDAIRKANAKRAKGEKARPLLPALSRAEAEKIAKRNLKTELDALKVARKMVRAQEKTTGVSRSELLAGLTRGGNVRGGRAGRAIEGFTLADIGKARESVAKSLEAARDVLADLRSERAALRDQVASSIRSELDLTAGIGQATTDALGRQSAGVTTFASVAGAVKTMAAKAKKFAGLLGQLAKKGIPAGLIQEIAGYGTEQGTEVAKALLSGSATEIKELAADFTSLENWSKKAGEYVAAATYDTAISAQEGLIAGLEADDKKLEKAAKKLAKKLAKAVKKALGIKSPSRLFRDEIGSMLPAGVIEGIDDGQRALDARVAGMVPTPNVPTPVGMSGNRAEFERDARLAKLIAAELARNPMVARAYLDDREARKVTQKGIQEIRRTDPAVLR